MSDFWNQGCHIFLFCGTRSFLRDRNKEISGHELGMNLLNNPIYAPEVDRMLTGNMIGAK